MEWKIRALQRVCQRKTIMKTGKLFRIRHLLAVATSAVGETRNSNLLINQVFRASGIKIEIIGGTVWKSSLKRG